MTEVLGELSLRRIPARMRVAAVTLLLVFVAIAVAAVLMLVNALAWTISPAARHQVEHSLERGTVVIEPYSNPTVPRSEVVGVDLDGTTVLVPFPEGSAPGPGEQVTVHRASSPESDLANPLVLTQGSQSFLPEVPVGSSRFDLTTLLFLVGAAVLSCLAPPFLAASVTALRVEGTLASAPGSQFWAPRRRKRSSCAWAALRHPVLESSPYLTILTTVPTTFFVVVALDRWLGMPGLSIPERIMGAVVSALIVAVVVVALLVLVSATVLAGVYWLLARVDLGPLHRLPAARADVDPNGHVHATRAWLRHRVKDLTVLDVLLPGFEGTLADLVSVSNSLGPETPVRKGLTRTR